MLLRGPSQRASTIRVQLFGKPISRLCSATWQSWVLPFPPESHCQISALLSCFPPSWFLHFSVYSMTVGESEHAAHADEAIRGRSLCSHAFCFMVTGRLRAQSPA